MLSKINAIFALIQLSITIPITILFMYAFHKTNRTYRRIWGKLQLILLGIKLQINGSPDKDAKLLLINHQSMVDIITLEAIHPENLAWIAKKEISQMPIFGHIMNAPKMISVDREDKRSIIHLLKEVKDRVENGRVVAIFPEGTRGDGISLLEFQMGAKVLAEKLNLRVQPIVIANSKYILNEKNFTAHRGEVSVTYLEAFNPSGEWYDTLHVDMQKVLDSELSNISSHR